MGQTVRQKIGVLYPVPILPRAVQFRPMSHMMPVVMACFWQFTTGQGRGMEQSVDDNILRVVAHYSQLGQRNRV
jgi:hypothetical protein